MKRQSEKGSALLIVLGFLSFMVVSAVAFAVWMRTERIPSSALRRNVANRHLVKAAIAQAMSQVDDAIRSHVFPGANTNKLSEVYRDRNDVFYDWWEGRVFMPPDPDGETVLRYAPISKTVSVLNMEALGYLPPAIANDVRLLHRSSWAAKWDYFNFDAGRYAFCAVNVSDMLDVNKVAADAPRTSAAVARSEKSGEKPPPSRFSYAYLFRDGDNFSSLNKGAEKFDKYIHEAREEWKDAPMVSLMDYNLSIGPNAVGDSFWSPFYELAIGKNNTGYFYRQPTPDDQFVKSAERQPFVTDSWFPPSEYAKSDGTTSTPVDLSLNQPFKAGSLKKANSSLSNVMDAENETFWEVFNKECPVLCVWDMFTLFDYLDEDSMPLSLAMPCVERVPMIAGLESQVSVDVSFVQPTAEPDDVKKITKEKKEKYFDTKIKLVVEGGIGSKVLFPFKDGRQPPSCEIEAFASVVFVEENASSADSVEIPLRSNGFARNLKPQNDGKWRVKVSDESQCMLTAASGTPEPCLVVTLPSSGPESCTPAANIVDESKIEKDILLRVQEVNVEKPLFRRIETYAVTPPTAPGGAEGETHDKTEYQFAINPFRLNKDGQFEPLFDTTHRMTDTEFDAECKKYRLRPCLVVWARIKHDEKTVDLVPATFRDDLDFNGIDNVTDPPLLAEQLGMFFEYGADNPKSQSGIDGLPILRFMGDDAMTFTYEQAKKGEGPSQKNSWKRKSFFTVDPRFNWAPEDWYSSNDSVMGEKWYKNVFDNDDVTADRNGILDELVGYEFENNRTSRAYRRGDRANDPFLFVSDQGYLQSVGELAFLPHLSVMRAKPGATSISVLGDLPNIIYGDSYRGDLYDGKERVKEAAEVIEGRNRPITEMPSALAAWKSYQCFRTNPKQNAFEFGANLYRRGLVNGNQGLYVNPFTQSQEVMLAALANPPLNYWVASTNYTADGKMQMETFDDYKKFMFSDNSAGVQLKGRDLNKIATFLRHRFEDLASMIEVPQPIGEADMYVCQKVWEDMFDALDWSGTLDCTVENVYDRLEEYYNNGDSNIEYYRDMYKLDDGNLYSDLNHFARGGGRKAFNTRIRLNKNKAVHKDDEFGLKADPLRGQVAGDTGSTSCYQDFFDVDRKFLHSYWRDCFANRQQLFLIFVRAEATALGAAGEGTPPQQGGRAVALVWRDPMPSTGADVWEREDKESYAPDRRPHRMRILFYRQFD